ncbi:HlyD family efflux transporter periplasmic adaptor subunit [candidate division KSB1 bacterium]|nr:efflux RND transporter periplasmic adaptor subunit [candidate division KSB1 bacterium]RQW00882.1 MAG: HlyD family efflux transporter periplasmic adaptor subunit [candidate division KSB1 bacterium]
MTNRLFLIVIFFLVTLAACRKDIYDRTRVQQGYFRATLTETGELQALRSKVIIAPNYNWNYGRPMLVALAKEGTLVQEGDWIGQIDTTGVVSYLTSQENALAIEEANFKTLFVQQETQQKILEATLREQEASLRQARIDTQRVRFEAPSQQEIARLRLQIAEIAYKKAVQNFEHTKIIQEQDVLIQRDKIRQIKSEIEDAYKTLDTYKLVAPGNGMVVYKAQRGRGPSRDKIKVGDEIRRGSPLIGLPDLSEMKALTTVNEADIGKINMDQKVIVRLDAFPDIQFAGKVIYIGKICRYKDDESKVKVFDIEVLLENATSICRPGMTVNCEIIVAEYDNAIFVDNEYIIDNEDGYFVIVERSGKKQWIPVKLGSRNNDTVVVEGDLKAGEKLVDPRMEDVV